MAKESWSVDFSTPKQLRSLRVENGRKSAHVEKRMEGQVELFAQGKSRWDESMNTSNQQRIKRIQQRAVSYGAVKLHTRTSSRINGAHATA